LRGIAVLVRPDNRFDTRSFPSPDGERGKIDPVAQTSDAAWTEETDEPDWFGETSPFETEAQLASALPVILSPARVVHAVTPQAPAPVPAQTDLPAETAGTNGHAETEAAEVLHDGHLFEVVEPAHVSPQQPTPLAAIPPPDPSLAPPPTWSVRIPGVEPLPQRLPGRTGWSIRNSVRILRRAEELVMRLRQEAVVAAFNAAGRAIRGED
jgi:hypothetical protein